MSEAQTELVEAIDEGDLVTIKRLHLKSLQYFDMWHIFEDDYDLQTPVHHAVKSGNLKVIKYLIEDCGLDSDANCGLKMRPIDVAAMNGDVKVIKYLVHNRKVDPKKRNKKGLTVMSYARKGGDQACIDFLKPFGEAPPEASSSKTEPSSTKTVASAAKSSRRPGKPACDLRSESDEPPRKKQEIGKTSSALLRRPPPSLSHRQSPSFESASPPSPSPPADDPKGKKKLQRRQEHLHSLLRDAQANLAPLQSALAAYSSCLKKPRDALTSQAQDLIEVLQTIRVPPTPEVAPTSSSKLSSAATSTANKKVAKDTTLTPSTQGSDRNSALEKGNGLKDGKANPPVKPVTMPKSLVPSPQVVPSSVKVMKIPKKKQR